MHSRLASGVQACSRVGGMRIAVIVFEVLVNDLGIVPSLTSIVFWGNGRVILICSKLSYQRNKFEDGSRIFSLAFPVPGISYEYRAVAKILISYLDSFFLDSVFLKSSYDYLTFLALLTCLFTSSFVHTKCTLLSVSTFS
jgi:hypothetical protein